MRLISIIGVLLFALPANAQVIPLEKAWGPTGSGMRSLSQLDETTTDFNKLFSTPMRRIHYYLGYHPKPKSVPVIVLQGIDKKALMKLDSMFWQSAWHDVPLWQDKMRADTDLTLVFYSYGPKGLPPKILSVEKRNRIVELKFQLASSKLRKTDTGGYIRDAAYASPIVVALIPIGKFTAGKVEVKITELPAIDADGNEIESKVSSDHVSSSTVFEIR